MSDWRDVVLLVVVALAVAACTKTLGPADPRLRADIVEMRDLVQVAPGRWAAGDTAIAEPLWKFIEVPLVGGGVDTLYYTAMEVRGVTDFASFRYWRVDRAVVVSEELEPIEGQTMIRLWFLKTSRDSDPSDLILTAEWGNGIASDTLTVMPWSGTDE